MFTVLKWITYIVVGGAASMVVLAFAVEVLPAFQTPKAEAFLGWIWLALTAAAAVWLSRRGKRQEVLVEVVHRKYVEPAEDEIDD